MKEKFLQFFTGKMGKSVYIAAASAVVCVATVAGSTVAVHNHNQKIDAVLESLEQAESITETVTESAEESVSASGEVNTQQNANGEPAGDKALQYIAEYDKLTAEYQSKRAELEKATVITTEAFTMSIDSNLTPEEIESYQNEEEAYNMRLDDELTRRANAKKELEELEKQYEKDIAALKARYGIS